MHFLALSLESRSSAWAVICYLIGKGHGNGRPVDIDEPVDSEFRLVTVLIHWVRGNTHYILELCYNILDQIKKPMLFVIRPMCNERETA